MQVTGLCRFSYPAIGGFQIEHETIEDRRAFLYSSKRLNERFHLLETVTLPGLKDQTDEDFEFLIVVGNCLPADASDRLYDLTAGVKQVRIIAETPDEHRKVMKRILNQARTDPGKPCLQFRLDDDDAVAVDFIERLRGAIGDFTGLIKRHPAITIDFNCGYLLDVSRGAPRALRLHRSLISAGLGMYVQGNSDLTIMNFAHQRLARFMPVVSYPDKPMWIRSLNGFNDSPNARKGQQKPEPLDIDIKTDLAERFAVDAARLTYSDA
ncbi:putative rhamnosyl transferase [Ruegeria sp.]|uniref:putative rhamnosyl transferase n=1 Tax=Ruegeria sp. TaxID=1879320 RepID=UPI003C7EB7A5